MRLFSTFFGESCHKSLEATAVFPKLTDVSPPFFKGCRADPVIYWIQCKNGYSLTVVSANPIIERERRMCVLVLQSKTPPRQKLRTLLMSNARLTPGASLSLQLLSDCFYRSFSNTDQALVPHIHNGQYLIDNRVDQIPLGTGQHTCHWWLPHKRKGKFKIGWWTKNLYSLWKAPQNGSFQTVWWPLNV